tara:strand:+ start:2434 stop:2889 length:456 start_codon:yes stop_codon:yes gene_type:complete
MKKIIQILILLIPFIFLVFIISCSNNSNNQFSEFKLEKDLKKIELYLKEKDLILVEHRRTSNQQFTPSESELLEPVLKVINFPSININSECLDVGTDIRESFNNYPIFVLSKENEILAYLVKFPNSTGIVSANKNLIPVILLDDLLKYLGC